jgi:putative DNA primase/helicase
VNRSSAPEGSDAEWSSKLYTTAKGAVKNTFANICTILRGAPDYAGLRFNEMTVTPELGGAPVSDARLALMREDIERRYGFSPATDSLAQAILGVASEHAYHPVREYLEGLVWDHAPRLASITTTMLDAEPSAINAAMVRAWFVSAVARAYQPGCKVDTCLVLVGPQGARKSTFFRALGGAWFADTAIDIESKDAMQQINAAWIYELGELDSVTSKAHAGRIKGFITSQTDKYRLPFGRAVSTVPRSNVIVGSTNESNFLMDPTGARRFWCLRVGRIDATAVEDARDQLWAEAVAAHNAGERWWLDDAAEKEHRDAVEAFAVSDPWENDVAAWLLTAEGIVTTAAILTGALRIDIGKTTHRDSLRAGAIMRALGWQSQMVWTGEKSARVWQRITDS